jgi:hypothetical protein
MKQPRHAQYIYLQCGTHGYWTRYYRGRSLRKMGVPILRRQSTRQETAEAFCLKMGVYDQRN